MKPYLTILLVLLFGNIYSQTDTAFWFAAPDIAADVEDFDKPIYLRLSTLDQEANVTISQPANTNFKEIQVSIPANSTKSVDLTNYLDMVECKYNETGKKGLKITSTNPITAYYDVVSNTCLCNPELFTLKGQNALGTLFYVPFQTLWDNSTRYSPTPYASFIIVATENATHITITPTKNLMSHAANVPFQITLNKGETFSATAATQLATGRPAGSKIVSDKPIAVTMSDDLVSYDACADLVGDQLVPANILGTEYIAQRGYVNEYASEKIFIVATKDNTTISIDGTTKVGTINTGETKVVEITGSSLYITASAPIYVLHISGYDCELGGAILPSLRCRGSYEVAFVRATSQRFGVNIITKKGAEDSFLVNGKADIIKSSMFSPVSGTNGEFVSARAELMYDIPVDEGSKISNTKSYFQMGIINGNNRPGCNYGYFSNFSLLGETKKDLICGSESASIAPAVGRSNVLWEDKSTEISRIIEKPGKYWCTSTVGECTVIDTFIVRKDSLKIPSVLQLGCGESVDISATAGFKSYLWSTADTAKTIKVSQSGIFSVTATDGDCSLSATCNVTQYCNANLLAYYKFCGGSLSDFSGNKHNLKFASKTTSPIKALYDDAFMFSNGVILKPQTVPTSLKTFSVCAWIRPETGTLLPVFYQTYASGYWELRVSNSELELYINDKNLGEKIFSESISIPTKQYSHLAVTCDNTKGEIRLWLNGVSQTVFAYSNVSFSGASAGFQIGGNTSYFAGIIDEVCLYSKALETNQIDSIYHRKPPVFSLGKDLQLLAGESVTLSAPIGFSQYVWKDNSIGKSLAVSSTGNYWLAAVDSFGCRYVDTVLVNVQKIGSPFICNGIAYVSAFGSTTASKTQLHTLKSKSSVVALGSASPMRYDALGFNPIDNFLYAYDATNQTIIRIFADGSYTSIGKPDDLPNETYSIGDCDKDGNYWLVSKNGTAYVIDISARYTTLKRSLTLDNIYFVSTKQQINIEDIAIHPQTNDIYYFSCSDNLLYKANPQTGVSTAISTSPQTSVNYIGALWFDAFNRLYGFGAASGGNTQTTTIELDTDTGIAKCYLTTAAFDKTDGCACARYIDLLATATKNSIQEGEDFTYKFTISNNTGKDLTGYNFVDTLPAGIELLAAPSSVFGVAVKTSKIGKRQLIEISSCTIPTGITRFSIDVKSGCVLADSVTINQAFIPGLPQNIGGKLASDDSTTTAVDDAARVTIESFPRPTISAPTPPCEGKPFRLLSSLDNLTQQWTSPQNDIQYGNSYTINSAQINLTGEFTLIYPHPQCTDTVKKAVKVNPLPTVSAQSDSKQVCFGQPVTLSGKGAQSYSWTNNVKDKIAFVPQQTQKYTVTGTDINGCQNSDQVEVIVNQLPDATIFSSANKDTVCYNSPILLTSKASNVQYSWSTNEASQSVTVYPKTSGSYSVTVIDQYLCSDTSSISFIVDRVIIDTQHFSKKICQEVDTQTVIIPGNQIAWYTTNDTITALHFGNTHQFTLTPGASSQTVYIKLTNKNGCNSDLTPVSVHRNMDTAIVSIHGQEYLCEKHTANTHYEVKSKIPIDSIEWFSQQSAHYSHLTPTLLSAHDLSPGIDTLRLYARDTQGCEYHRTKIIYVLQAPHADFDWVSYTGNMLIQYTNSSDSALFPGTHQPIGNTYLWTYWLGDTLWKKSGSVQDEIPYPYGYHDVLLVASNDYGCKDSIRKTVFMDVFTSLYVPSAFAPEHISPELNEFHPKGMNINLYEISIYDQWGNQLWYSNKLIHGHPAEGWSGMYKGQVMKSDIYIWKIRARFENGNWWRANDGNVFIFGNFVLLR